MEHRIFSLQGYDRHEPFAWTIVTSQDTPVEVVSAAWSYAVRYTAKGLDLPDHEAALKLVLERHPSWQALPVRPDTVTVNLKVADDDIPE